MTKDEIEFAGLIFWILSCANVYIWMTIKNFKVMKFKKGTFVKTIIEYEFMLFVIVYLVMLIHVSL